MLLLRSKQRDRADKILKTAPYKTAQRSLCGVVLVVLAKGGN